MKIIVETGQQLLSIFWEQVENAFLYKLICYKVTDEFIELINEKHPLEESFSTLKSQVAASGRHVAGFSAPSRSASQSLESSTKKSFFSNTSFFKIKMIEIIFDNKTMYHSITATSGYYFVEVVAEGKDGMKIDSANSKAIIYRWG